MPPIRFVALKAHWITFYAQAPVKGRLSYLIRACLLALGRSACGSPPLVTRDSDYVAVFPAVRGISSLSPRCRAFDLVADRMPHFLPVGASPSFDRSRAGSFGLPPLDGSFIPET